MYDFNKEKGTYVYSVEKDSQSYKAGLKKGDLITKINDVEIYNSSYLKYELYKYKVGDTVKITYKRDDVENTIDITLSTNK